MTTRQKTNYQAPIEVRRSKITRARDMLKAGYPTGVIEKRIKSDIHRVRKWAAELGMRIDPIK
jgi:hypothetical protein